MSISTNRLLFSLLAPLPGPRYRLFARPFRVGRQLPRRPVAACCTQFRVRQIAVGALRKSAMAERGKRKLSSDAGCRDDVLHDAAQVPQILAFSDPWYRGKRFAVRVIPLENQPRNHVLLDGDELGHQLREEGFSPVIEKRPPGFLPVLGMDDLDTVGPFLWPVVRDLEGAEDMLLALQPFPGHQRCRCNREGIRASSRLF